LAVLAATCSAAFATYTYYYTDLLTSINTTYWTQYGILTAGSGGLTSSDTNGGSLISKVAVPDGSSNYEVETTLTLNGNGGTYVTYLRASGNALSGPTPAGTTYAIEVQNPTFSGSACSATLAFYKIISGSVTSLASSVGIPCNNGMTVRAIYSANSNNLAIYVNNTLYNRFADASISSGKPGIGVRNAPAGNSIAEVQLGGMYAGTPVLPTNEISVSAFSNRVEMQWPGASDGTNGPGIYDYWIYRNGTAIDTVTDGAFVDATVSPSTTYTYWIVAYDYDVNTVMDTISVTTPPAGAIDPREIGVRPTGAYWGGAGEQIDMRSGNLNYTTPILKAMGRGGWGVGFNLTYNSQNWRQDPAGTWQLGEDVGYGYGWKLLAGSLLQLNGAGGVSEYLFTDSTGAQYHLNQVSQNSGDTVWSSLESIYVSYDSTVGKLHFNDGSFWVMGSVSAGTEWDAGTTYPTLMEDSNGNEVTITYNAGVGVTWGNSSSRISTIQDVRGGLAADYTFSYNADAIPHLTGVANTIGTAENYSFAYKENYSLDSPFNSSQNFGTVALLASSTVTGIPLTTEFTYDTTSANAATGTSGPGQLTQVTTPYGGHIRWAYNSHSVSGTRSFYQVQYRYLSMQSGMAETTMQISRGNDNPYPVQQSGTLDDLTANARKIWNFQTNTTFDLGLQTQYSERILSSGTILSQLNYTWAQTPTTLNPYIGTTITKLDPGQTYSQWKQTTQILDQYGNLLTMQAYNFGPGAAGSLARTYSNTYLYQNNPTYANYYIFNRLLTSTVTDGTNTATLVSNIYDSTTNYCPPPGSGNPAGCQQQQIQPPCSQGLCDHDNVNYSAAFTYRGNVTSSTTPTTTTITAYDTFGTGSVTSTTVNGVTSTVGITTDYAAPGAITTNQLLSTMNWTSFLGLSSATGPNGDTGSITYDANARPTTTTSPYGAVTTYTYNDTWSPPNKIVMADSHGTETVMDGFGRTITTITGSGTSSSISTIASIVDTQYAPCGCSPLGKLSQQSQPYASLPLRVWNIYTYDASGRTLSVKLPDNSTTTYQYQGNTVTVTDPAGKWKTFTMDAFGNLTTVLESDPSLGNVTTSYTYDVLNHLTLVSMPRNGTTQTRTFNYNTGTTVTGFLQSATNPENGTVSYTYNSNNLLASKTDAKNQKLTYTYDSYNRLTLLTATVPTPYTCLPPPQPCNPPPPTVQNTNYYYDSNTLDSTGFSLYTAGRLAAVQYYGVGPAGTVQFNEMYSYTQPYALGVSPEVYGGGLTAAKRLQVNQYMTYQDTQGAYHNTTATANLDTTFTYNSEGSIASMTYPSTVSNDTPTPGPSYNYSYNSMYQLSGMTDSNHNTIVNNVSYNAANQLLTIDYPTGNETRGYNVLGQLTNVTVQLPYSPYSVAENLTYTYPNGTNNGKISSMSNAVSGEVVTYAYDSLNRLLTANSNANWGQQYVFDGFGNLLQKKLTAGSGPNGSQTVNPANNQISVYGGYDANGNTADAYTGSQFYALSYDAQNRLSSMGFSGGGLTIESYAYDSQNRRIWSWPGTLDSWGNTTGYTVNVYTPSGQKLAAYTVGPSVDNNNGQSIPYIGVGLATSDQYFGSRRLATMDQLGSVGNYFPWGEDKGGTSPQDTWNFATYWRDSVSGLDYANNRYYSNAYGRFMTPDPYMGTDGGSGDPEDPQSWNRYAYTTGDPVNWVDSQGLFQECPACSIYNSDSTTVWQTFSSTSYNFSSYYSAAGAAVAQAAMLAYYQSSSTQLPAHHAPQRAAQSICDSKILSPSITSIFSQMGKDLDVNPVFIMAVALQESGWNLSHVYGTNSSSNGQPLNNLFGTTYAGNNNIAYPSVQASATAWEQNWGPYLSNDPTTIQAFVSDLVGTSGHMYNTSPNWPISIEGGSYTSGLLKGKTTIGTYQSLQNALSLCNISLK
jgi:RHS repeat-associated protein